MMSFLLEDRHLILGESYVSLWKVEVTLDRYKLFSLKKAALLRRFVAILILRWTLSSLKKDLQGQIETIEGIYP